MMRCGQMMLSEAYVRFFIPAGRCLLTKTKSFKRIKFFVFAE